jgi:MbtH protein
MSSDEDSDDRYVYKVLVNDEEQYALGRDDWPDAPGWRFTGKSGTKDECLAYVTEVWKDMRPLSLRLRMNR